MNSSKEDEFVNRNQSLLDNFYVYNTTDINENDDENDNLLFELVLILCLVILCLSTIVNLTLAAGIWRKKNKDNGILSYVLQLCILDAIGVTSAGIVELYTFHQRSWTLGRMACRLYLGAETFTGAMLAYTLLCLDLHTLVKANIRHTRIRKIPLEDGIDCECTSQDSLLSVQSGERNIVTVDYRQKLSQEYKISSRMPSILVWFLSASLCIPALVLSSTSENLENDNSISCSLIFVKDNDDFTSILLILLLGIFRVFVPLIAMVTVVVCLLTKLKYMTRKRIAEKRQLILAVVLTVTYIFMSSHRPLFMVLHGITSQYMTHTKDHFLLRGSYTLDTSPFLTLSITYYLISFLRPIFCCWISTELKTAFRNACRSQQEEI